MVLFPVARGGFWPWQKCKGSAAFVVDGVGITILLLLLGSHHGYTVACLRRWRQSTTAIHAGGSCNTPHPPILLILGITYFAETGHRVGVDWLRTHLGPRWRSSPLMPSGTVGDLTVPMLWRSAKSPNTILPATSCAAM